jgi:hypothetical protein
MLCKKTYSTYSIFFKKIFALKVLDCFLCGNDLHFTTIRINTQENILCKKYLLIKKLSQKILHIPKIVKCIQTLQNIKQKMGIISVKIYY